MYIPDTYDPSQVKTILLANSFSSWGVELGPKVFEECPVNACTLSTNWKQNETADAILFRDTINHSHNRQPSQNKQIWIIYELESAVHSYLTGFDSRKREQINWTATYRVDSDIVTPYEKWVYYDERHKTDVKNREVNFAAGKTRQVAWFVSNCNAPNNRLQYAKELQKYIPVDIYGGCGPLTCPRSSKCFDLLNKDYRFYLSFENSNCKDYITEKLFANGLSHNVLPIVMGAPKSDYLHSAPVNSFIHVDDFSSPKQLAQYLHHLNENDTAYNEYFQWKGTGEFINTFFWCRLCTMVHDGGSAVVGKYTDVSRWWHEGACEKGASVFTTCVERPY
uniref:Fucosyltransferase n=1 Tax=Cacopsylla melanoneura TaxID=428564 RepID=A0A8D8PUS8_9HEMI